jgi:hypothetical protein
LKVKTWTPRPRKARSEAGQDGGERLAFASLHLGQLAVVNRETRPDLDIERFQADRPFGRFSDNGERVDHDFVEGRSVMHAPTDLCGIALQFFVGELAIDLGASIDLIDLPLVSAIRDLDGAAAQAGQSCEHPADE